MGFTGEEYIPANPLTKIKTHWITSDEIGANTTPLWSGATTSPAATLRVSSNEEMDSYLTQANFMTA